MTWKHVLWFWRKQPVCQHYLRHTNYYKIFKKLHAIIIHISLQEDGIKIQQIQIPYILCHNFYTKIKPGIGHTCKLKYCVCLWLAGVCFVQTNTQKKQNSNAAHLCKKRNIQSHFSCPRVIRGKRWLNNFAFVTNKNPSFPISNDKSAFIDCISIDYVMHNKLIVMYDINWNANGLWKWFATAQF